MSTINLRLIDDDNNANLYSQTTKRKRDSKALAISGTLLLLVVILYGSYNIYKFIKIEIKYSKINKNYLKEKVSTPQSVVLELQYADKFQEFIKNYKKNYLKSDETLKRYKIYIQTLDYIQKLNNNNNGNSAKFGENEFTDWSDDDFQKILLRKDYFKDLRKSSTFIKPFDDKNFKFGEKSEVIPEEFDWRPYGVLTPVKSQHNCGSCWAFATAGTVESAYAIANKELRNLSEQELLDCNLENNACDGGDVDKALKYVHDNGLMKEDEYPYVAYRQNSCMLHGETTKIKVAYFLHQDEQSIIDWLIHYGPVNVGMNVTGDMKAYKGGVYTPDQWECENKIIGTHALNIVGYGTWNETGEKYWIIKNSWGDTWGIQNGYFYLARGINSCGVEDEPVGVLA